jgi:23S rRNA (adenine2030-N6)-methyltransferase
MKYRHSFHAGNFADVHKHVALLALIDALKRKEKGFLYLETHAGRGAYDLSANGESAGGIGKLVRNAADLGEELRAYLERVNAHQERTHNPNAYPGSPLLACGELREQDRAVLIEVQAAEASALERAVQGTQLAARVKVERGDGFELMRAQLPPVERRGLTFIDPPYEENTRDFTRLSQAIGDALRRFATGVIAAWYPIKDERTTQTWQAQLTQRLEHEALLAELWLYPRDARVALNGSGLLIINPPYRVAERMQVWQPRLLAALGARPGSGTRVRELASDWRKLPSRPE